MAKITQTFPHSLGKDEAVRRFRERIAAEKVNKANVANVTKEVWNDPYNLDYSMTVFGYRIDGSVSFDDSSVTVTVDLPMGAALFKGMITDQLTQQIELMLR